MKPIRSRSSLSLSQNVSSSPRPRRRRSVVVWSFPSPSFCLSLTSSGDNAVLAASPPAIWQFFPHVGAVVTDRGLQPDAGEGNTILEVDEAGNGNVILSRAICHNRLSVANGSKTASGADDVV